MYAVIMAGGKGTRIASVNSEVPKPMIPIDGKPILEYELEVLRSQNITNIILVVGHLGNQISDYFGDGSKYEVSISYIYEKEPLGTAGALFLLEGYLQEDFLLLNGDIIFDINIGRFINYHLEKGGEATIFTHPNGHPYDSGIICTNENGKVTGWLHKEDKRLWYQNRVNAGIHLLKPSVLEKMDFLKKTDLDRDILKPLISRGQLYAYDSPEYVKDMGTPDRYSLVMQDLHNGIVSAKNLVQKQKAIFLDRDGTINKYVGFLKNIEEFELIDGVGEAIKMINDSGYLAIVVTNQPVIARGEITYMELKEIHNKMETLLGMQGAYIDDLFFCPHHPDKGFEGEIKELKINCECRKPKPGLLKKAAKKYNIDLGQSWMIGDSYSDIEAGRQAGCHYALLSDHPEDVKVIPTYKNLYECIVDII